MRKKAILVIAQVICSILGFILVKLIAQKFSPDVYGEYTLEFGLYTLIFGLIFSAPIQFTTSSFNNQFGYYGNRKFVSSWIISSILVLIILFGISKWTDYWSSEKSLIVLICFTIVQAAFKISTNYLNVQDKYIEYSVLNIIKSAFPVVFCFGLIYFDHLEFTSIDIWIIYMMGLIGSVTVFFAFKFSEIKLSNGKGTHREFYKELTRFGTPILLGTSIGWFTNYLDRYILDVFLTAHEVGIYSANYSLGSKALLLISPIFMVLITPKIYSDITIIEKKKIIKNHLWLFMTMALVILFVYLGYSSKISMFFLSASFSEGSDMIWSIHLAHIFLVGTGMLESVFFATKNTKVIFTGNVCAFVVTIIALLILIPVYGMFGAALSTISAFAARFVYVTYRFIRLNVT